ncbi:amidase family protein [Phenylobacterium sp.]|jgi:amidase|uniref:amidase family protein n=1 Tax=Phenylobacterium sp. TaxID=1871053 RepID=UPI002F3F3607
MSETLSRDTLDASATDIVEALAARRVSALELADEAIARIEARDGPINAVVVRDFDRARDAARAADAALARGERRPLLGLPMTVKESHNVAGLKTTWGFDFAKDFVAAGDSVGVSRLKAAGAVILGKTNIPVSLADWQSVNPIYGRTKNPFDLERTPGGSSGGSAAALAAGMVPLEFGSDIGGSIRVPAAFCGVFGHKPSFELIPVRGHAPMGADGVPPPLSVVGPLARSAADLSLALGVLAGPSSEQARGYRLALPPARHAGLADFRIMVLTAHPSAQVDSEVRSAIEAIAVRLEGLGSRVSRGSALLPDLAKAHGAYMDLLNTAMAMRGPEPPKTTAAEWMAMLDRQVEIRRQWANLFEDIDVVLTPAFGTAAYPHDSRDPGERTLTLDGAQTPYFAQLAWPGLASLGNLPATAVPIGQTLAGLPIGMQVIGPYLEDHTTIGFARLLEREFGGFRRPPGL